MSFSPSTLEDDSVFLILFIRIPEPSREIKKIVGEKFHKKKIFTRLFHTKKERMFGIELAYLREM